MSTHDPASVPSSSPGSKVSGGTQPPHDVPKPASSSRRSLVLVGILALLLLALWYDYKVARPRVEMAYESVGKINNEYNALPGKKYVTEKDVQLTLNRKPARIINEGPYHVEVYSWRAGLPIRSHNYYAVYSAGTPLVFLKHYKFELPMEELKVMRIGAVGNETESAEGGTNMETPRPSVEGEQPTPAASGDQPSGGATKIEAAPLNEPPKEESVKQEPSKEEAKASEAPPAAAPENK